jgi:hypothetical protein
MSRHFLFRKMRHSDRDCYTIYVLWMIGYPARAIASALGLRVKQVAGIIHNSEYKNRAAMTDEEIRAVLADLERNRYDEQGWPIDGGRLDRIKFTPRPLTGRQRRRPSKRKVGIR